MVTDLAKSWPNRRGKIPVLDGVELSAAPGAVVWIGGANGSGKTTLLRLIGGIIAPDRGSIRFGTRSPERDRREYARQTGFLSAGDRGVYARLSVRRHLDIWGRIAFLPPDQRPARIQRAIEDFGLTDLAARRADRLSLGQRQRVKLAMTFLHRPTLVLLDEPLNSLDEAGIEVLRAAIERTRRSEGSVVWCSPPLERGALASDLECRLEDGRLTSLS